MRRRSHSRLGNSLCTGAVLAAGIWWLALAAGVAGAKPPLSLDDITAMRADQTTTLVVIRELRSRGRAFELDAAAREKLAVLGFTTQQVEVVGKTKRGDVAAADALAAKGKAAGPAIQQSPEDIARLERLERVVKRAVELTRGVTVIDTDHARLVLGPGVPPALADDARKLEGLVARRFPGPLADGVDKRGVNVAVFAGESEYAEWIAALEKALEENGVRFAEGTAFADQARRSPAVYLDGLTTMRMVRTPEDARRTVAHSIGFHSLAQLSRNHCGDGLKSGFANVTETMLFGSPATMVKGGYADREVGVAAASWPQTVKQRFAAGTASTLAQVLDASFEVMEFPQYAECWSFASVLCMKPEEFSRLVLVLREGGQPQASLTNVYKADAATLTEGWKALAAQAR